MNLAMLGHQQNQKRDDSQERGPREQVRSAVKCEDGAHQEHYPPEQGAGTEIQHVCSTRQVNVDSQRDRKQHDGKAEREQAGAC